MGRVYEATDRRLERQVAIKVLATRLHGDPRARARLHREARVQARVEHPHLLRLMDVCLDEPPYYLVMDMLEGEDLASWVRDRGPLEPREVARFLVEIAGALDALHENDTLHRDLKPANVMRREDGAFVLMDLGLARDDRDTRITGTGVLLGTPNHLPPEVAMGGRWSPAGDQFQLGAVAFHVLTGRVHLPMRDMAELALVYAEQRFGELRGDDPGGPELHRVVARAREPDPKERYPSLKELAEDADKALVALSASSLDLVSSRPSGSAPGRRRSRTSETAPHEEPRPRTSVAAWAVLLLLLGILAGMGGARLGEAPSPVPSPALPRTTSEEAFSPVRVALAQMIQGHQRPDGGLDRALRGGHYKDHLAELIPIYRDPRIVSQWGRLVDALAELVWEHRDRVSRQDLEFFLELEVAPVIDHLIMDLAMVGLSLGDLSFRVPSQGEEEFRVPMERGELAELTTRVLEVAREVERRSEDRVLADLPPYCLSIWTEVVSRLTQGRAPRAYVVVGEALAEARTSRRQVGLARAALAMVPPVHARAPESGDCPSLGDLVRAAGRRVPALAPRLRATERALLYGAWTLADLSLGYHCPEHAAVRPAERMGVLLHGMEAGIEEAPSVSVVQLHALRSYAGIVFLGGFGRHRSDAPGALPDDLAERAGELMRRASAVLEREVGR